jgi:hypothetical protein
MNFRLAEFPVVDGVEVRSFGDPGLPDAARPRRALRFVYRARPREQQLPIREDFGFKVGGTMLVVDGECDEMLVPRVTRIEFDPDAEFITGRIERLTADSVVYATGGTPWSRGYTYILNEDVVERRVSEEFFLCEVMVLDKVEWDIELQRAKMAHDCFMNLDNPYRSSPEINVEKRADISLESTPQKEAPATNRTTTPLPLLKQGQSTTGAHPTAAELRDQLADSPAKRFADRAAERLD